MLTRKHFEAIASILANAAPMADQRMVLQPVDGDFMRRHLACELACYFETQNENFDMARFMAASKVEKTGAGKVLGEYMQGHFESVSE